MLTFIAIVVVIICLMLKGRIDMSRRKNEGALRNEVIHEAREQNAQRRAPGNDTNVDSEA
jgi:hypothetical protein